MDTAISISQLTRVYEVAGRQDAQITALNGVSAEFTVGTFTAVVGASGSGKSTLLHCMAGLDQPTSGSVTAADNVAMPARLAGRTLSRAETETALKTVGLAHRTKLKPHQLSGGERQRVAIARVMASEPAIVFADEPTGALDLESARVVLEWLRGLTERGTTVVMVTHDVDAAALADATAVMHQGSLVAWDSSHDPRRIADLIHDHRRTA